MRQINNITAPKSSIFNLLRLPFPQWHSAKSFGNYAAAHLQLHSSASPTSAARLSPPLLPSQASFRSPLNWLVRVTWGYLSCLAGSLMRLSLPFLRPRQAGEGSVKPGHGDFRAVPSSPLVAQPLWQQCHWWLLHRQTPHALPVGTTPLFRQDSVPKNPSVISTS